MRRTSVRVWRATLRAWEERERRKAKEYERDKEKEISREEEREREAKKLKEFLEDYDDERDDLKYYKGKELQHRLSARVREAENDGRERSDERTELEKLKRRVFQDRTDDDASAQAQFDQLKREQEALYKPRLLIDVNLEQSQQRAKEEQRARERQHARTQAKEKEARHRERFLQDKVIRELPAHAEPINSDSSPEVPLEAAEGAGGGIPRSPRSPSSPPSPPALPGPISPQGNGLHHQRRHRHHRRQSTEVSQTQSPASVGAGGTVGGSAGNGAGSGGTPSPPAAPVSPLPPLTPDYTPTHPQGTSPAGHNSPIAISMNFKNPHPTLLQPVHNQQQDAAGKKRKLDVRDVFNTGESDEEDEHKPRRHSRHHRHHHHRHHHKGSGGERSEGEVDGGHGHGHPPHANPPNPANAHPDAHADQPSANRKSSKPSSRKDKDKSKEGKEAAKSQEEKRRNIKSLIDKIPTQKEALFSFKLDTSQIDSSLMEKKIRPWINKKIIEYIGEPEPTLVDFICSKVLAGSSPQGILDDVQMVLDEEAEVFVVKMWRLLIYEVEAKKLGLIK